MTHDQLVPRAIRWLSGSRRCNPVFAGNASCGEIPDAVGWTSMFKFNGCIVVECKASRGDFYRDKHKYQRWARSDEAPGYAYRRGRFTAKEAQHYGLVAVEIPRMGDFRYYMCAPEIITDALVAKHAPDHGLLWVDGRSVKVIREATRREKPFRECEIRYLRFAIINGKDSLSLDEQEEPAPPLFEGIQ